MKILVGDFDAKVGREDIFNLTIGNESLHRISNDNGVRVVVAKVRETLAVSKQTMHRFHIERFNLKKLNKAEDKEQYQVDIS
jgi:hypothetical protein